MTLFAEDKLLNYYLFSVFIKLKKNEREPLNPIYNISGDTNQFFYLVIELLNIIKISPKLFGPCTSGQTGI